MSGRLWLRSPFDRLSPRRVAFGDRVSGKRCVPLRDGLMHVDGAADAVLDVVEGCHEAVPHGLDLGAVVASDLLAKDAIVLPQEVLGGLIAKGLRQLCGADNVGEEEGDGGEGGGRGGRRPCYLGGGGGGAACPDGPVWAAPRLWPSTLTRTERQSYNGRAV